MRSWVQVFVSVTITARSEVCRAKGQYEDPSHEQGAPTTWTSARKRQQHAVICRAAAMSALTFPPLTAARRALQSSTPPPDCGLVKNFIARQGIIFLAGILFLVWTAVRVRLGYEKRNIRTFAADCSKQAGQQMLGGALMVALGTHLAHDHAITSPLAWCAACSPCDPSSRTPCTLSRGARHHAHQRRPPDANPRRYGAQYPFEIVLTTIFTGLFRRWAETGAVWLGRKTRWRWLNPFKLVGQYGPKENDFRCKWYWAQLVQAVLLIGLPARMCALLIIFGSLAMPKVVSPVYHIASGWFNSGLTCEQQTAFILYVLPLTGDAVQFIIIDKLQAVGFLTHEGGVRDFENLEVRRGRPADLRPPLPLRTATHPGLTHTA